MFKKNNTAFTLIEIAAVVTILLLLLGISLPLMKRGTSVNEIKMTAFSIKNLLYLCYSNAKAAGKVYLVDMDTDISANEIEDPSDAPGEPDPVEIYRFSILKIYSASFDETADKIKYKFEGESFEIPVSVAAYTDVKDTNTNDHIYFKPDGSISAQSNLSNNNIKSIFVCSEEKSKIYYKCEITKASGNIDIKSYKD
ncbi:MAG: hypothetical protein ACD_79C00166G0003 [uncultured bacterium]|nr:MAG: hypothetical protein ACD_79C00166G0003 [uncultured bacterium]